MILVVKTNLSAGNGFCSREASEVEELCQKKERKWKGRSKYVKCNNQQG